jgi:hypothetical protein
MGAQQSTRLARVDSHLGSVLAEITTSAGAYGSFGARNDDTCA